jgi:RNA polymerase sigma-70 factor (ECF subfamily)
MLSSFVEGTDKSGTFIPYLSPPAGDETLVVAAKNGDEQAFEILVERHRRKLFVVALRITRVREDAEDIAQQSFQKAFLHLRRFEGKSSFLTWLTRIAINEALMWLRGSHRHREMPIDEVSDDVGQNFWRVQVSDSDPEASYLQQEETKILAAAMGELKPGLRRAIELRDLEELSTAETAQRMGLSISATKSTLSRGRRKLREALKRNVRSPRMTRGNSRRSHAQPSEKTSPRRMSSGWREGALYGDGSVDCNICSPCVSQLHRT